MLGSITVEPATDTLPPPAQFALEAGLPGTGLRLLGYNQDRAEAAPGDPVLLTLFWKCSDPARCGQISLALVDGGGAEVGRWELPAVREDVGTGDWPETGFLRGQHLLQMPAEVGSGAYRFVLNDEVELGTVTITAPDRRFEPPPLAESLGAPFRLPDGTAVASLAGIAAAGADDSPCSSAPQLPCSLSLVWRGEALMPQSYRVFVHLVDEQGRIVAQADGEPSGWTRPTTGWLPGEYILDRHVLAAPDDVPGGPLSLRVGLYDPETGARLSAGAADYVELPAAP
jgi:hypothetical protein